MRAHFSALTLAEIFRDLYSNERSGVLTLTQDASEKRLYFDRGMILFAESPEESEDLGPCLVREAHLSTGALTEARASLGGSAGNLELARVLVHRDLIAKDVVAATARTIVERIVRAVFLWENGSAAFAEGPAPDTNLETDILATVEAILGGILGLRGFEPVHDAMRGLDNRLRLRTPAMIPLERLTLSPSHGFILSRVDGNTTMNELLSILPPEEEVVASRFLFGLLILGVLEYDPPVGEAPFRVSDIMRDHADRQAVERIQEQTIRQAYEAVREQSPYDMLGVTPAASRREIERAYDDTKSQFSRDRILPRVRERFRSELAVIESRLVESYITLTQPDRAEAHQGVFAESAAPRRDIEVEDMLVRVEMDKAKSKLALEQANRVADAYYAKARRAMREGDFHNAIQYAKLATSYNASDARYYYLLADCQVRNPEAKWQRMAEENYTRATQLDPWNAGYWVSLGRFYKKRGLKLRAKKQYEEALKLVPNNTELLREMETLG
jgi:tetratricopeptide (TPR) repeat protein